MNKHTFIFIGLSVLLASSLASVNAANNQTAFIVDRGPNSRTWAVEDTNSPSISPNPNGSLRKQRHKVIELATGMHYWNGANWEASDPSFESSSSGFLAAHTQHKVRLGTNLFLQGAVQVNTRDGVVLHSSPLGIGLYDAASGNFLLIAQVTNSSGVQVASNRVVYPNAFNGVCANVVYTIEKGSFHQDVVFTGRLDPASYGFPTNTTRIQMITEFYNPPTPVVRSNILHGEKNQSVRAKMASPDFDDQTLGFGEFVLGHGRSYLTGTTNSTSFGHAPVGKQFINNGGRYFLIESVEYKSVANAMQSLPDCNGNTAAFNGNALKGNAVYAALPRLSSPTPTANLQGATHIRLANTAPVDSTFRLARETIEEKGLVLDYVATVGGGITNSYVFQSDTTYLISGFSSAYNVTFEGGAVLKFPAIYDVNIYTSTTNFDGYGANGSGVAADTYVCLGDRYRPTIFTASDDDTAGVSMAGIDPNYTGSPILYTNSSPPPTPFGGYYLCLGSDANGSLSNLRFRYAVAAIQANGYPQNPVTWNNIQFVNCYTIVFNWGGGSDPITMNDCLIATNGVPFYGLLGPSSYSLNHCTVDHDWWFNISSTGSAASTNDPPVDFFAVTNSIFSNMQDDWTNYSTLSGDYNGFYNNLNTFGSDATIVTNTPYQTVGAGSYYLKTNTFQGKGTTNIDPALLAELPLLTTSVPLFLTNNLTSNTVLSAVVPRDTNQYPTLGYHYAPIDYLTACAISNATVTLTNGVVLAYGDTAGITMEQGGALLSLGTPVQHNYLVHYALVQEQAADLWSWNTNSITNSVKNCVAFNFQTSSFTNPPSIETHFTCLNALNGESWLFGAFDSQDTSSLVFKDSEFYLAGSALVVFFTNQTPRLAFTNNVFHRPYTLLAASAGPISSVNNLFVGDGGTNTAVSFWTNNPASPNTNFNNAFDGCYVYLDSICQSNAMLNGSLLDNASSNIFSILTNITWVTGPLGYFYQPTNSPLIDWGNTTADQLGYYHYTTQTNEVKEANSVIDIGYHYVALGTNGLPVDTTDSGIPDYLNDSNGNGIYDPGIDLGNWLYTDSAGNGVNNTWLMSLGMDPHVNYTGNTNDASNYTYDAAGRLQKVSQIRSENITFDAQGNIQTDSH